MHICVIVFVCVCVLSDVQCATPQGGAAVGRPGNGRLITPTSKCAQNHLTTNSINFTFPPGYLWTTEQPFCSPINAPDIWTWVLVCLRTYVCFPLCSFGDSHPQSVVSNFLKDSWIAEDSKIPHIQLAGLSQLLFSFDKTRKLQDAFKEEDEIRKPL